MGTAEPSGTPRSRGLLPPLLRLVCRIGGIGAV